MSSLPDSELTELERQLAPRVREARFTAYSPDAERVWHAARRSAAVAASVKDFSVRGASTSRHGIPVWQRVAMGALACGVVLAVAIGVRGEHRPETKSAPTHEYATRPGQRAALTLDDGTHVILNVDSRLRVIRNAGARAVYLEGAAQFTVTHDPKAPFVVYANGTTIRDLATTFTVDAYTGSGYTVVAVRDGRIAVNPMTVTPANRVVLGANDRARIAPDGRVTTDRMMSPDENFAWTNGRLVIREQLLGEALVQLSRWYGLDFRAADSTMLGLTVNAELPEVYDPHVLSALAATMRARVSRSGNVVTFISQ